MASDLIPEEESVQAFHTDRPADEALDAAEVYLEGAGLVSPALRGQMVRTGDGLAVHYGRITTHIDAGEDEGGTLVQVTRRGQAPLENTRTWLFGMGLAGFVLAWGLAWYNQDAGRALPPLVTMTLFFLGIVGVVTALYVVDRSLEKRSASLCASLEDAMRGDPLVVLQREVDGLERSATIANTILAYCAFIVVEFIVYLVLWSGSVRDAIDQALTLDFMQAGFGLPVVPALLFGLVYFWGSNRLHGQRLALVERRLAQRLPGQ